MVSILRCQKECEYMNEKMIGPFLKSLREEKHLTQEDLASIIMVDRTSISKWERNKAIPLNETLTLLSEFYDVSVNEILAGERFPKEAKEEMIDKVTLSILAKKQRIHKILKLSVVCLLISIGCFFGYYFFETYNTMHVYSISGINKEMNTKNGVIMISKEDIILRIGDIYTNNNEIIEPEKVELFVIDGKEEKVIYYGDADEMIYDDRNGKQYIKYSNFNKDEYNYFLRVYLDDRVSVIDLRVSKDFSNDNLIYNNYSNVGEKEVYTIVKNKLASNNKFTFDNKNLTYYYNDKNINITCFTNLNSCTFIQNKDGIEIRYYYDFMDNIIEYRKKKGKRVIDEYHINANNLSESEKKIYQNFIENYFNRYVNY